MKKLKNWINNRTPQQKQTVKNYAVYTFLVILFAVSMYFLFAPPNKNDQANNTSNGFNINMPNPSDANIESNKETAYKKQALQDEQRLKVQTLDEFAMLQNPKHPNDPNDPHQAADIPRLDEKPETSANNNKSNNNKSNNKHRLNNPATAYQEINNTLGNFYSSSNQNTKQAEQQEQQAQELAALKAQLAEQEARKQMIQEQKQLLEESLQMAAKYLPQSNGSTTTPTSETSNNAPKYKHDEHNEHNETNKIEQTYQAVIHTTQTVSDGQTLRIRLLQTLQVNNTNIPINTLITGNVKMQGERLHIEVVSLAHQGNIIPLKLTSYDTDGQKGIHIPHSMERNATKEILANMGNTGTSSISLNQGNALQQIASDLSKNLVQGASKYMSKKILTPKVTIKAGHQILLIHTNL